MADPRTRHSCVWNLANDIMRRLLERPTIFTLESFLGELHIYLALLGSQRQGQTL